MDLRWTSSGGLLLDGTGNLATTLSSMEELQTMVATRRKAGPRSWKLYTIGAGFDSVIGSLNTWFLPTPRLFAGFSIRSRATPYK